MKDSVFAPLTRPTHNELALPMSFDLVKASEEYSSWNPNDLFGGSPRSMPAPLRAAHTAQPAAPAGLVAYRGEAWALAERYDSAATVVSHTAGTPLQEAGLEVSPMQKHSRLRPDSGESLRTALLHQREQTETKQSLSDSLEHGDKGVGVLESREFRPPQAVDGLSSQQHDELGSMASISDVPEVANDMLEDSLDDAHDKEAGGEFSRACKVSQSNKEGERGKKGSAAPVPTAVRIPSAARRGRRSAWRKQLRKGNRYEGGDVQHTVMPALRDCMQTRTQAVSLEEAQEDSDIVDPMEASDDSLAELESIAPSQEQPKQDSPDPYEEDASVELEDSLTAQGRGASEHRHHDQHTDSVESESSMLEDSITDAQTDAMHIHAKQPSEESTAHIIQISYRSPPSATPDDKESARAPTDSHYLVASKLQRAYRTYRKRNKRGNQRDGGHIRAPVHKDGFVLRTTRPTATVQRESVLVIQRVFRGHRGRKRSMRQMLDGARHRLKARQDTQERAIAARKIQCTYRRHNAIQTSAGMLTAHDAVPDDENDDVPVYQVTRKIISLSRDGSLPSMDWAPAENRLADDSLSCASEDSMHLDTRARSVVPLGRSPLSCAPMQVRTGGLHSTLASSRTQAAISNNPHVRPSSSTHHLVETQSLRPPLCTESAALVIQRLWRGALGRMRAHMRREAIRRFKCQNCGNVEQPGVYCKACGHRKRSVKVKDRKVPTVDSDTFVGGHTKRDAVDQPVIASQKLRWAEPPHVLPNRVFQLPMITKRTQVSHVRGLRQDPLTVAEHPSELERGAPYPFPQTALGASTNGHVASSVIASIRQGLVKAERATPVPELRIHRRGFRARIENSPKEQTPAPVLREAKALSSPIHMHKVQQSISRSDHTADHSDNRIPQSQAHAPFPPTHEGDNGSRRSKPMRSDRVTMKARDPHVPQSSHKAASRTVEPAVEAGSYLNIFDQKRGLRGFQSRGASEVINEETASLPATYTSSTAHDRNIEVTISAQHEFHPLESRRYISRKAVMSAPVNEVGVPRLPHIDSNASSRAVLRATNLRRK